MEASWLHLIQLFLQWSASGFGTESDIRNITQTMWIDIFHVIHNVHWLSGIQMVDRCLFTSSALTAERVPNLKSKPERDMVLDAVARSIFGVLGQGKSSMPVLSPFIVWDLEQLLEKHLKPGVQSQQHSALPRPYRLIMIVNGISFCGPCIRQWSRISDSRPSIMSRRLESSHLFTICSNK